MSTAEHPEGVGRDWLRPLSAEEDAAQFLKDQARTPEARAKFLPDLKYCWIEGSGTGQYGNRGSQRHDNSSMVHCPIMREPASAGKPRRWEKVGLGPCPFQSGKM